MLISVFGSTGKVGKLLIDEILKNDEFQLFDVFSRQQSQSFSSYFDLESFLKSNINFPHNKRVIIDFSNSDATLSLVTKALELIKKQNINTSFVIGTTGLKDNSILKELSKYTSVLYSANMSFGITTLNEIVKQLSSKLYDYDIEINEIHHKHKKDSPSGTALMLAKSVAQSRSLDSKNYIFDRSNISTARDKDEIGITSMRGGDVVGRHTVGFYADGEYLELTHCASSRLTFVKGALKAALFLKDKEKGFYSMQDVFES